MNPNENMFSQSPLNPPLILNTEVNKITGNQGGLASNKFSANEVPVVKLPGAFVFFSLSPFASIIFLNTIIIQKGDSGGFDSKFIILHCMFDIGNSRDKYPRLPARKISPWRE